MGIGVSIFLFAVGAILAFAVDVQNNTSGIDINTVGVILMLVGIAGIIMSVAFWNSWGGFDRRRRGTVVVDRDEPDVIETVRPRRRRVVEREIIE